MEITELEHCVEQPIGITGTRAFVVLGDFAEHGALLARHVEVLRQLEDPRRAPRHLDRRQQLVDDAIRDLA